MRLAYADPPYLGCSRFYDHLDAARWDDPEAHRALMVWCEDRYDGWALSCSTPSLRELLPLAPPVNRTCTDGTPNANSALYAAAWRAAKALGYRRLITYTQAGETGASLRGAGWQIVAERPARESWSASSVALKHLRHPVGAGGITRTLWEASFDGDRPRPVQDVLGAL